MDTDCRAREGRDWLGGAGPQLVAGQQPDPSPLVASRADASSTSASATPCWRATTQNIRNFDDPMTKAMPDHYVDLQNADGAAVAAGTARPRCRRPLGGTRRQGGGPDRRCRPSADGAASDAGAGRHRTRCGRRPLRRRAARTRRRPRAVDRTGDRRRGHPGLRGRPGAPPRRARARRRSAGAAPGRRSACSAAATRSATCSSRC